MLPTVFQEAGEIRYAGGYYGRAASGISQTETRGSILRSDSAGWGGIPLQRGYWKGQRKEVPFSRRRSHFGGMLGAGQ